MCAKFWTCCLLPWIDHLLLQSLVAAPKDHVHQLQPTRRGRKKKKSGGRGSGWGACRRRAHGVAGAKSGDSRCGSGETREKTDRCGPAAPKYGRREGGEAPGHECRRRRKQGTKTEEAPLFPILNHSPYDKAKYLPTGQ